MKLAEVSLSRSYQLPESLVLTLNGFDGMFDTSKV